MKKGKLIIIESGSDGSGKATQTSILYERLLHEGYKVKQVSFPDYSSESSALVKMYLRGDFGDKPEDVNPYATSIFFAIDRFASFRKDWQEFYNSGGIIISDRYTTSNMVHQAVKMNEKTRDKFLNWLVDLEFNLLGLPAPDLVVFLNVPPVISHKLMEGRPNKFTGEDMKDIHECNDEYLINSYNNSIYIAEKYEWTNISCTQENQLRSIEDIGEEIYFTVKEILE